MTAPACGAQYGSNPDLCYQSAGHGGTHSNKWGTTWAAACPTCGGSGEVPVNPDAAWSGHVQALTFRACPTCTEETS